MIIESAYLPRSFFAVLISFAFAFTSASGQEAQSPGPGVANPEYDVQPGDMLFISVWREETL